MLAGPVVPLAPQASLAISGRALRQMIDRSETFVKPTSAELCVNLEVEQIVWVTRNDELVSRYLKEC